MASELPKGAQRHLVLLNVLDVLSGPLLALLMGQMKPGQKICSQFELSSTLAESEKKICICGAHANEHGVRSYSCVSSRVH